jgi:hypothetical protein
MGTRSYAEGRDICNIHPHSAEEVMALADIQLRGYSYASPAVIKKQRRSRMSRRVEAQPTSPVLSHSGSSGPNQAALHPSIAPRPTTHVTI